MTLATQNNYVMLDLETLSTKSDAAIISIGVARFDESGVLDTKGWAIDQTEVFGHVDPGTVYWWMKQSDAAKRYSFNGKEKALVAAQELKEFLLGGPGAKGCTELWANDPDFDVVILRHWWDTLRPRMGTFPVSFRASRSFRTIKALTPDCDLSECYLGTAHNPVDDAAMQARAVIKMRRHLASVGSRIPVAI